MEVDDAMQFLIQIGSDKSLLDQARDAGKTGVEAFANSLGFSVTLKQLEIACQKLVAVDEGEIDESDLDAVSGGVGLVTAVSAGAALYAVGKAEGWW
jgi:hypothetical protein